MRTILLLFLAFLLVTAAQGQAVTTAAHVNTARQVLSIEAPESHRVTIVRIIDGDGSTVRTISTAPGSLLRFSISTLPPGRYLLRTNDPALAETWFTKEKEPR
ncbi:hypothetical protein EPD60_11315 [Flaviaesturariibacter flavus]|uniref:T9SS type A sorting domain-containing protein n=1 Tax=Flaviaesturariibacter flavus TaxID=2502780 RepID=A0A4R1BC13_9BACT|nr:hypothetical protein [Flaviaesturariibacter flavus]TCJ14565.1 hypothetical protein EPD60_11315 [Flaviaesturariibacter flavus]